MRRKLTLLFSVAVWLLSGCDSAVDCPSGSAPSADEKSCVSSDAPDASSTPDAVGGDPIRNSPPVLTTMGLSTYRPIVGERVTARPGVVLDADGDETFIEYAWFVDDMPVGTTEATMEVSEPGARIRLVARANDGIDAGPEVAVGPIEVIENTTRWRELLPTRSWTVMTVLDESHRRILLLTRSGALWELSLDEGNERFVKLFPKGQGPGNLAGASAVYDAAHRRVVLFGGWWSLEKANETVWQLDVRTRGGERWSQLTPSGDMPGPQRSPAVAYAPDSGRMYLVGGRSDSYGYEGVRDVWSMDLRTPGAERWTKHASLPTKLCGATLLMHPDEHRAYVIGGVAGERADGEGGAQPVSDAVYRMNIDAGDLSFDRLDTSLPKPLAHAISLTDVGRKRGLVAFGSSDLESYANDVYVFDFESESFADMSTVTKPPANTDAHPMAFSNMQSYVFWSFLKDPLAERALAITPDFSVFALNLRTDRWTTLTRSGTDLPPLLGGAAAFSDGEAMTIVGGNSEDTWTQSNAVWELRFVDDAWDRIEAEPDGYTARVPERRWSDAIESNTSFRFFSYETPRDVWELEDRQWLLRTVQPGGSAPSPRSAVSFFNPACDEWDPRVLGFFGGYDNHAYWGDTGFLICDEPADPRNCRWDLLAHSDVGPEPCESATVARTGMGEVVLFGGYDRDAEGPSKWKRNGVWTLSLCNAESAFWRPAETHGEGPLAGAWHTMTREEPLHATDIASFLVFGGQSQGGATSDVWRLVRQDADTYEWRTVDLAADSERIPPRARHVAVWDRLRQRLLVYGGEPALGDLWELRFPQALQGE